MDKWNRLKFEDFVLFFQSVISQITYSREMTCAAAGVESYFTSVILVCLSKLKHPFTLSLYLKNCCFNGFSYGSIF